MEVRASQAMNVSVMQIVSVLASAKKEISARNTVPEIRYTITCGL
jgi:hypothetical protein